MSPMRCRLCGNMEFRTVCDLGMTPLSNSYVEAEALNKPEVFYPLHAKRCLSCLLVQIPEFESPSVIFSDYKYFSSFSASWVKHCEKYVTEVLAKVPLNNKTKVVEIASNDGYLLKNFLPLSIPVLGIEPAENVADVAISRGIPTIKKFFGLETARAIRQTQGSAHLLIANNVLAHVPNINDFVNGIEYLLHDDGIATLEFPHLLCLLKGNQFDTIYHEHFSYISLTAAVTLFSRHGLHIFDVQKLPTHGGSIRIWVRRKKSNDDTQPANVKEGLREELLYGLDSDNCYERFSGDVTKIKFDLLSLLLKLRSEDSMVVGYGAAAKGNTLLNYCGIKSDLLPYVADLSPHKQGSYLPGSRIPVTGPERLRIDKPSYVLILPWNLTDEITSQLSFVRDWGGRFLVAVPEVRVLV